MKRHCESCDEVLIGRADKRFCSDQCRAAYNNAQNRESNNYVRRVNHILRKNRRILAQFNPDGKTKTHRNRLTSAGFNFNYFTHIYKTQSGNVYYFCYEQGYLMLERDYLALVVREERI